MEIRRDVWVKTSIRLTYNVSVNYSSWVLIN